MDRSGCENCKKNMAEKLKTTGQIPLTNALLTRYKQQIPHENDGGEHSVLKSMAPEDVVPFLKDHFHWRVTDVSHRLDSGFSFTGLYSACSDLLKHVRSMVVLLTAVVSTRVTSSTKLASLA